jgi:hypothetical protein
MLPFQLAGRNTQVLERFTPLGRLFSGASRTPAASFCVKLELVQNGSAGRESSVWSRPAYRSVRDLDRCAALDGGDSVQQHAVQIPYRVTHLEVH